MKKILFFIFALSAVAISCTKSEVVKAPGRGREVKFATYVGKTPLTKAESADLAYVQRATAEGGFQVYAFLHNYIEPTTETPEAGEEVYKDDDKYVNVSTIGTASAYMDKKVTWVGPVADDPETGDVDETADGYWNYDGVVYWPDHSTNRKLAFAAYALNADVTVGDVKLINWDTDAAVSGNAVHPEGQSYTKFTYTVPSAVVDQKDLLVSPFLPNQGLGETANAAPVEIVFKHLLSRVGFQVVANQDNNVMIDIQEIKLVGNFPKTGKVDLKSTGKIVPNVAENDPFETEYIFFPGDEHFVTKSSKTATDIFANTLPESADATIDYEKNRFLMIMPSEQPKTDADGDGVYELDTEKGLPGAYLEVQYQLTEADVQKARVSLDGWKFEAGKSYNFVFKVSTSSIEFEVEVESWNEHFGPSTDSEGNTTYPNTNGIFTLTPIIE